MSFLFYLFLSHMHPPLTFIRRSGERAARLADVVPYRRRCGLHPLFLSHLAFPLLPFSRPYAGRTGVQHVSLTTHLSQTLWTSTPLPFSPSIPSASFLTSTRRSGRCAACLAEPTPIADAVDFTPSPCLLLSPSTSRSDRCAAHLAEPTPIADAMDLTPSPFFLPPSSLSPSPSQWAPRLSVRKRLRGAPPQRIRHPERVSQG